MKGRFGGYWPMQQGGPQDKDTDSAEQIFKCTDCGAETHPADGWNGAPNPGHCKSGCKNKETDRHVGRFGPNYKKNFDQIFPNSPGAGV